MDWTNLSTWLALANFALPVGAVGELELLDATRRRVGWLGAGLACTCRAQEATGTSKMHQKAPPRCANSTVAADTQAISKEFPKVYSPFLQNSHDMLVLRETQPCIKQRVVLKSLVSLAVLNRDLIAANSCQMSWERGLHAVTMAASVAVSHVTEQKV